MLSVVWVIFVISLAGVTFFFFHFILLNNECKRFMKTCLALNTPQTYFFLIQKNQFLRIRIRVKLDGDVGAKMLLSLFLFPLEP